jgi:hypothetical protein
VKFLLPRKIKSTEEETGNQIPHLDSKGLCLFSGLIHFSKHHLFFLSYCLLPLSLHPSP